MEEAGAGSLAGGAGAAGEEGKMAELVRSSATLLSSRPATLRVNDSVIRASPGATAGSTAAAAAWFAGSADDGVVHAQGGGAAAQES
eukprot:CAMPEP_0182854656 /NCGR_PEP_ID=MMETSP0034_2-20130328/1386_1 /TAXON_ID=156128 /ORGANISM="Nephroselmis pyriformis, Strain CCMP717" /LENGTH=86 /DNA_ID=CAMNT_0024985517 /DNA_START=83 /DNA_END=341 /DNA_ORIENTATION=-